MTNDEHLKLLRGHRVASLHEFKELLRFREILGGISISLPLWEMRLTYLYLLACRLFARKEDHLKVASPKLSLGGLSISCNCFFGGHYVSIDVVWEVIRVVCAGTG